MKIILITIGSFKKTKPNHSSFCVQTSTFKLQHSNSISGLIEFSKTNIQHYDGGQSFAGTSSRTQPVYNPANGQPDKDLVLATTDDVNAAVAAAKAAYPSWANTPPLRRALVLDQFKSIIWERMDELATAITLEHGKTFDDAKGEVTRGLEVVELFDNVSTDMAIYRDEIFGPVLSVVRTKSYEEALAVIDGHEYANGTAIFTRDGDTARTFVRDVEVGMVGVNVPIPVPMAFHSFGGWKSSIFGDHAMHGMEGVRF